jgi:hypothetical protein
MERHLSDDELLAQLYRVTESDGHREGCGECARRWNQLLERRAQLSARGEESFDFLAAQRRKIYSRLGERQPSRAVKWVPALATAFLLVIGAFIFRPEAPVHPDPADAQLFSEVYSMEQSTEPRAADPIHALFEDNQ